MPTLEIVTGKNAGLKVDVSSSESEVTFGNRRTSTVVLKDPWISFSHAVILKKDGAYVVADKRSRAGTFLNGTKVDERGRSLKDGDTIGLGKTEIRFRDIGGAASGAAGGRVASGASEGAASSSPFAPAAAPSGPFTPFTPVAPANGGAATAARPEAEADLRRAQADLQALRAAMAAREKALAEAQAKLRALESQGTVGPDLEKKLAALTAAAQQAQQAAEAAQVEAATALERAVNAETEAVQLRQQHEETVAKARIRVEELGRLNQTLEARLRQGGAGEAVDQERELSQLREELRRIREAGRARLDALMAENAALKAAAAAATAPSPGDSERVTELEAQLQEAERSRVVMEQRAEQLEAKLETAQTEVAAARAERAPVSNEENAALEKVIQELNLELENTKAELERLREAGVDAAPAAPVTDAPAPAAAAAPAPVAAPAPAADAGRAAELEAACEKLRRERDEAREDAQTLRKDLEDINDDMLAQEEEYQQRIAELEAKLSGG